MGFGRAHRLTSDFRPAIFLIAQQIFFLPLCFFPLLFIDYCTGLLRRFLYYVGGPHPDPFPDPIVLLCLPFPIAQTPGFLFLSIAGMSPLRCFSFFDRPPSLFSVGQRDASPLSMLKYFSLFFSDA